MHWKLIYDLQTVLLLFIDESTILSVENIKL